MAPAWALTFGGPGLLRTAAPELAPGTGTEQNALGWVAEVGEDSASQCLTRYRSGNTPTCVRLPNSVAAYSDRHPEIHAGQGEAEDERDDVGSGGKERDVDCGTRNAHQPGDDLNHYCFPTSRSNSGMRFWGFKMMRVLYTLTSIASSCVTVTES